MGKSKNFESQPEPLAQSGPERTFWQFKKQPIAGGGEFLELQRYANFLHGTATIVPLDWNILYREAYQLAIVAKRRNLSLKAISSIAPHLANWSTEDDLRSLLDQCYAWDDGGEASTKYLDRRGRRKRIPIKDFVDKLMAPRIDRSPETIRSYRERWARKHGNRNPNFICECRKQR
jgi:hypothetical protein